MLPGETREQVWQEFESLIKELRLRDPDIDAEMEPPMLESFPLETSPTERIVQAVTAASQEVRGPSQLIGVPYMVLTPVGSSERASRASFWGLAVLIRLTLRKNMWISIRLWEL